MTIITISRGTFSGGKSVAEELASRLNYNCLSREEVVKDAAAYFDIDEKQLDDALIEAPGFLHPARTRYKANVNYFRHILLKRLRDYNLVYHGYAGHILLDGIERLLRVRIIAGLDYRVRSAMKAYRIDEREATKQIIETDRKRNRWAQAVLGVEWNDSSLYDVAFNLDSMSLGSVVDAIERVAKNVEYTSDKSTSESVEDLILSSNVWCAIIEHCPNWAFKIQVSTRNGEVVLFGDIASRKHAEIMCSIASGVNGVKGIVNQIQVASGFVW